MSELPTFLPGIEIASGLARVAGNARLYLKLLRHLAADAPAVREKLSSAVMNGDAAGVREVAHSLKGSAGNLSVTEVAEAAAQLELLAKSEDFPAMFMQLDLLEQALARYVETVSGLKDL